ncbi:MAG: DUF3500 domain-containing protein [Isosphaeraceae bacterium]
MSEPLGSPVPDHETEFSRREFVKTVVASAPLIGAEASPAPSALIRFHASLTREQRSILQFPFDHPLQWQVRDDWAIVRPTIADLTAPQRALCREIFQALCSEEGHERFLRQMTDDAGGFDRYHVALFGEPEGGRPCQWVLTGRHLTLRGLGDSSKRATLGGPIFYGHSSEPSRNVWWDQSVRVNRIFATLDGPQRDQAVVDAPNPAARTSSGLVVAGLDASQKEMVRSLFNDMLMPFREVDPARFLQGIGGIDSLRLSYFPDRGGGAGDGEWRVWKLEGPGFRWSFHGVPHVHAWVDESRG